jgi:hypothetical protein
MLLYGNNIDVATKIGELEKHKKKSVSDLRLRHFTCSSGSFNLKTSLEGIQTTLNTTATLNSLNGKQNTLLAGDNITITNNTISSTGGGRITQDDLDLKQDVLSRTSHVNINSLIVSSDNFSIATVVSGQISCNTLLIDGNTLSTGTNTKNATSKTIFFGLTAEDNAYGHTVIENRIYSGAENSERLLF